jgi:PAS domain-containing protein
MLLDLMLEVGLDGTIYNYHSHRKIHLRNLQIGLLENFKCYLQMLQIQLSLQYVKLLKWFSTDQYTLEKKGELRWYEHSTYGGNGEHDTHFICLSRDITKVKLVDESLARSEERYRGLLDNLDAGIVVHSRTLL